MSIRALVAFLCSCIRQLLLSQTKKKLPKAKNNRKWYALHGMHCIRFCFYYYIISKYCLFLREKCNWREWKKWNNKVTHTENHKQTIKYERFLRCFYWFHFLLLFYGILLLAFTICIRSACWACTGRPKTKKNFFMENCTNWIRYLRKCWKSIAHNKRCKDMPKCKKEKKSHSIQWKSRIQFKTIESVAIARNRLNKKFLFLKQIECQKKGICFR